MLLSVSLFYPCLVLYKRSQTSSMLLTNGLRAVPEQVNPPQGGAEGHRSQTGTAEPYLLSTAPVAINVGLCCTNYRGRVCRPKHCVIRE